MSALKSIWMKELLRSNDPTMIAFASALLEGEDIEVFQMDVHMSVLEGSIGILPRRLDCVAVLRAGILIYENDVGDEVYVAVDEGILIKTGAQVQVSVRDAISVRLVSDLGERSPWGDRIDGEGPHQPQG